MSASVVTSAILSNSSEGIVRVCSRSQEASHAARPLPEDHPDCHRYGIEFTYAYGSFVDGPGFRDIDVAIWTTADAMEPVDLRLGIALTRIAGYPVDVRIINQAPVP